MKDTFDSNLMSFCERTSPNYGTLVDAWCFVGSPKTLYFGGAAGHMVNWQKASPPVSILNLSAPANPKT